MGIHSAFVRLPFNLLFSFFCKENVGAGKMPVAKPVAFISAQGARVAAFKHQMFIAVYACALLFGGATP
jgi:hypothetical protein